MLRIVCQKKEEDEVEQHGVNCSTKAFPGIRYGCPSYTRNERKPCYNNDHLRNSKLQSAVGERRMQHSHRPKMYKLGRHEHVQRNRRLRPASIHFRRPGDENPSRKKTMARRAVLRVAAPAPASFQPEIDTQSRMRARFDTTANEINLPRIVMVIETLSKGPCSIRVNKPQHRSTEEIDDPLRLLGPWKPIRAW